MIFLRGARGQLGNRSCAQATILVERQRDQIPGRKILPKDIRDFVSEEDFDLHFGYEQATNPP